MYRDLINSKNEIYYDCFFEPHIKKKYFVVMPYRSRSYEQPSNGLNSKIEDKNGSLMINWKKSFLNNSKFKVENYTFLPNMTYTWRKDCHSYSKFNILINNIKYLTVKSNIFIKLKNLIKYFIGDKIFYCIKNFIFKINLYR
jgi:hypothetical protein